MATLQAFHGQQEIKDKYVVRVRAHREADHLIRGSGWDGERGCAIGCTLEDYEHSRYPIELGIPEWLARVEDTLFEGMPEKDSQQWPEQFLSAIRPGADLEKIKAPFLIFILESCLKNFDHEKFPDCKAAVGGSIAFWNLPESERTETAWSAARSAAWSAAWSAARSAARSAAESAAWSAAESAAWSAAWSAARSAAESAAYKKFADKLLELLAAA